MTRRGTFAIAVLAALGLSGCGERGIPVSGTVKLGGAPLSAGVVALEPEAGSGTTGAGAIVRVKEGRFDIGAERQLTAGKYLVRVSQVPINMGDPSTAGAPRFKAWESKVEIGPDSPPLDLDVPNKKR